MKRAFLWEEGSTLAVLERFEKWTIFLYYFDQEFLLVLPMQCTIQPGLPTLSRG